MKQTPQSEPIPGKNQVKNNAGGYVFKIDKFKMLERFLFWGSEGGTYYVSEQKLTMDNAKNVLDCIKTDGKYVVDLVVEISDKGRAPRNTPAEFVLALCACSDDPKTRSYAMSALPKVCRIGTHLFHFLEFVNANRGWGRGLRAGVARWYNSMPANDLAYQVVKYQQRDGWSHKDALILAHPKPVDDLHNTIYGYVINGLEEGVAFSPAELNILNAFESAKKATTPAQIVRLIAEYNLPRECIPTEFLNDKNVWAALLEKMPITATIRNLGKMTEIGLLTQASAAVQTVVERITDESLIHRGRVHPMQYLFALKTYAQGQGFRGSLKWNPVPQVVNALDAGFYMAFGAVEPTGKHRMLALDISGSMTWPSSVIMNSNVTAREASAAMALVTAAVEPNYEIVGFHGNNTHNRSTNGIKPLDITSRRRLDDVVKYIESLSAGSTDCALPMIYALENGINADSFEIYTDNESWSGAIHPTQALAKYREKTGIPAKLVAVGMVATEFTVADPTDPGSLNVTGFDTAVPNVISEFVKG